MDDEKRQKLEQAGWKVGTVTEFLGLSPEEIRLVERKVRMAADNKGESAAPEATDGKGAP